MFAIGKGGWVLDGFIGNVEDRDCYSTILQCGAKCRIESGRRIASRPVSAPLCLVVLGTVSDKKHIRQRTGCAGSGPDFRNGTIHAGKRVFEMRAAGSEV